MTVRCQTEKVGTRVYVVGNTFAIKDRLKEAGCHWDGERKQWWIGAAKSDAIQSLVGDLDGKEVQVSKGPCIGKAEYKGRTYYIIGRSDKTRKYWLTTLDCAIDFWAAMDACNIVKEYHSREYRGQTVHTTVASIRSFIEESKVNDASKRNGTAHTKRCWECGCAFTHADAKRNGGDWSDSYCGC